MRQGKPEKGCQPLRSCRPGSYQGAGSHQCPHWWLPNSSMAATKLLPKRITAASKGVVAIHTLVAPCARQACWELPVGRQLTPQRWAPPRGTPPIPWYLPRLVPTTPGVPTNTMVATGLVPTNLQLTIWAATQLRVARIC